MLPEYQLQIIKDYLLVKSFFFFINWQQKKIKILLSKLTTSFKFKITIKKNHGLLEFKQGQFLKPYIENNTELWKEAEKEGNKIKKQNAKSRNNAINR